jgi:hypothetical protein
MSASIIKQQLHAAILSVQTRIRLASDESQFPLMSAKVALEKVNELNGVVVEMGNLLSPQLARSLDFNEILEELSRVAQTCGSQLPSLPLLTTAQRAKASQTVTSIRQRCVQMASEASRLCELWLADLVEPVHHALKLHQALLLKRTDTLERMQHAQQALVQYAETLDSQLTVREQQLLRLNERYEMAMRAITDDLASKTLMT